MVRYYFDIYRFDWPEYPDEEWLEGLEYKIADYVREFNQQSELLEIHYLTTSELNEAIDSDIE